MRALAGQAMRKGAARGGGIMVLFGRCVLAICLLAAVLVGGLAWRLSQGGVTLPWLAHRLAAAASGPDRTVTVGKLTLSWAGFSDPGAVPLHVGLRDVAATGAFGTALLAQADVTLAWLPLLAGRAEPETAALSGLRLRIAEPPPGKLPGAGASQSRARHAKRREPAPGPALGAAAACAYPRRERRDAGRAGQGDPARRGPRP